MVASNRRKEVTVWVMDNMWAIWLALILLFLIIEMVFTEVYFLMTAGGAIGGLFASMFQLPLILQIVVSSLVTIILLLLVRPLIVKQLKSRGHDTLTNVDALIGAQAAVIEPVDRASGLVKIGGDVWSARTAGEEIPSGSTAVVSRIDGATAIVKYAVDV